MSINLGVMQKTFNQLFKFVRNKCYKQNQNSNYKYSYFKNSSCNRLNDLLCNFLIINKKFCGKKQEVKIFFGKKTEIRLKRLKV